MLTIEELREILKLPIDDFKMDSSNSFELKLIFRNNDVGRIFNPMIKSVSRDGIIDTSRIKWGPIFEHYKVEIERCIPDFNPGSTLSPLKYKSVIVRDLNGHQIAVYNMDYVHPHWVLVL